MPRSHPRRFEVNSDIPLRGTPVPRHLGPADLDPIPAHLVPQVTRSMTVVDGRRAVYTDFTTASRFDATYDVISEIRNAGWKLVPMETWHEIDGTGIWREVEPRQPEAFPIPQATAASAVRTPAATT